MFFTIPAFARTNGTYVQPHYQTHAVRLHYRTYAQLHYNSRPENTVINNYSNKGNVNPRNGKFGRDRYLHDRTSPYYQGLGRVDHSTGAITPPSPMIPEQAKRAEHAPAEERVPNQPNEIPLPNQAHEIPLPNQVHEIPLCVPTRDGCK